MIVISICSLYLHNLSAVSICRLYLLPIRGQLWNVCLNLPIWNYWRQVTKELIFLCKFKCTKVLVLKVIIVIWLRNNVIHIATIVNLEGLLELRRHRCSGLYCVHSRLHLLALLLVNHHFHSRHCLCLNCGVCSSPNHHILIRLSLCLCWLRITAWGPLNEVGLVVLIVQAHEVILIT